VHPAAGNWSGTLLNGLLAPPRGAARCRAPASCIGSTRTPRADGRRQDLPAVTALVRAIAAREVHAHTSRSRTARAPARFSIDAPIGRDPQSRVRMAVRRVGKPARTDVELRRRASGVQRAALHAAHRRTHQIRVHLASRAIPLVADAVYGGARRWACSARRCTRRGWRSRTRTRAAARLRRAAAGRLRAGWHASTVAAEAPASLQCAILRRSRRCAGEPRRTKRAAPRVRDAGATRERDEPRPPARTKPAASQARSRHATATEPRTGRGCERSS
jgi:hypothetical protein